jgi:hypothetical protein
MTNHTTNPYPVDSDNVTRGAGIPADDLDRMIAATIPGETWRAMADKLTPEQADMLSKGGHLMSEADLLDIARDYAAHNALQASLSHIAAPAGTTRAAIWFDDGQTTTRECFGRAWNVGDVNTRIVGTQETSGALVWRVEFDAVDGTLGALTAEQTREMVTVLIEAADELDRLTGDAPPFM